MSVEARKLPVAEIEATSKTQVRVRLDVSTIDDYAKDMQNGDIFPPLVVFAEDGSERYILADGFHRLAALEKNGTEEVDCIVYEGGLPKALLFALSANRSNGLRRSNADKHHAAVMICTAPSLKDLPLRDKADACGVSHETIRAVMAELNDAAPKPKKEKVKEETAEENVRPTKPAPTQAEVDQMELSGAIKSIRSFPFSGSEAPERMNLSDLMKADIEYCLRWLEEAHAAFDIEF